MIKVLEVYSESMPSWIADNLDDNGRLAKQFDFHNAIFHEEPVPTSNRDKRLKDPSRINFFLFDEPAYGNKRLAIYYYGNWYNRLDAWGYTSWRDVVDHTVKYAWASIDSGDSANELRKARAAARDGAVAMDRLVKFWYGDRDKSGYFVDKSKYKRILSTKKLDTYISDFDRVKKIIDDSADLINNFIRTVEYGKSYALDKIASSHKAQYGNYSYIDGALIDLKKIFSIASDLNDAVKNVESGKPASSYEYKLDELKTSVSRAEALYNKIEKALSPRR